MTSGFAYGITVTVRRHGAAKDRWGDTPGTPVTHTVDNCAFYLRSSTELVEARDTVLDTGTLLAPFGADIHATTDEITLPNVAAVPPAYRGTTWKVNGSGAEWRSPFSGWEPGTEFTLTREKG